MTGTDRLARPRLVALWDRVAVGATVLVTAQHRSGIASSLREWADGRGLSLVRWSSNRQGVPAGTPDADVVLLELEGMRDEHAHATLAVRERWPDATLIAVSSTQWPPLLLQEGVRPERVFSGSLFGFTADEAIDRAAQLGVTLTWDGATALLARVGTHAGFVDGVLRAAARRGALDDAAIAEGCGEATAYFASAAAAGVYRPNGWQAVLLSARIGPMPRRTLLAVWGRDEVVRAALDNILQSGFFTEDLDSDTIALRPDIRAAVERRIESEARSDEVDGLVAALASGLLDEGRTDDGWGIVAGLPRARTTLLRRHWWRLGELDVGLARPWLEEAVRIQEDPELRVALARALVDVTSAGHSGRVPAAAQRDAQRLLDEASWRSPDEAVTVVIDTLRATLLRQEGRYAEALAAHEELADGRASAGSGPSAVLSHASALVQAALSALDAGRPDIAAERLSAGAAIAHAAGVERLASYAHEIRLVVTAMNEPIAPSYQTLIDNLVGARVEALPLRELVAVWSALYAADAAALHRALGDADSPAFDDPLALRLLSAVMRALAHGLLGTSAVALRELELLTADIGSAEISPAHRAQILWAHTEALLHVGAADRMIEELQAAPEEVATALPMDILFARAHLSRGEPERVIAGLSGSAEAYGPGILAIWVRVLLFLAYRQIGTEASQEIARQHLGTAIVAASRARPVLPFALQGHASLMAVIHQAEQLSLDAGGQRLVADLVRMRDGLQIASGANLALSERERAVLARMGSAESTKHLAQLLHVSPNTVKTQLRSIYRKLGVSSWADARDTARRLGLDEAARTD
ncbi:LuxR C-terminal-related transcriptional regulator [Microbacterium sp. ZXX196]|uniref:LuxR C-terminal-related transcriptional regulator n=1 Tax=Microbacterium sp. ZXX196 TaxID=2609291 RepID=UPI0012B9E04B|nr:LuxR C-terminal-related transcriptional regulator [Microbacterium sp. ZXX196]MTE23862.1 hypothetical protein [Microbacterium sp. ZXX196]